MRFEFATAGQIVFGAGVADTLPEHARRLGARPFLLTGAGPRAVGLATRLVESGRELAVWRLAHEPTIEDARQATEAAGEHGADLVISVGGGSVVDLGKAVAALLTNGGDPLDYVEVIGRGRPLTSPSVPFIAVPTTAGTGSEVTRNAVLASPADRVKVSLRSPFMLPRIALVDPQLTLDLPPALTASTGMDALTQLIEPYLSAKATPLTDVLCVDGMVRVARSLRRAYVDGQDLDARADMALASLYGGLALANAALGVVHAFAAPVGGRFDAPHGAVCAALLPGGLEANLQALRTRGDDGRRVPRAAVVAGLLTGDPAATPEHGIEWLRRLRDDLGIPGLRRYGVTDDDVGALAEAARRASSMRGNPIALEPEELQRVLVGAL